MTLMTMKTYNSNCVLVSSMTWTAYSTIDVGTLMAVRANEISYCAIRGRMEENFFTLPLFPPSRSRLKKSRGRSSDACEERGRKIGIGIKGNGPVSMESFELKNWYNTSQERSELYLLITMRRCKMQE